VSTHPANLLEHALGELAPAAAEAVERHAAGCAACRGELAALRTVLGELGSAAPPAVPPRRLRDDLLGAIAPRPTFGGFARRFARIFDLAEAPARALLAGALDAPGWEPFIPGVGLYHFEGGPRVTGADSGLVRFAAGSTFPHHEHLGEEVQMVLAGSLLDHASGKLLLPGDILQMAGGTSHSFTLGRDEDCICAVLLVGGINIVDELGSLRRAQASLEPIPWTTARSKSARASGAPCIQSASASPGGSHSISASRSRARRGSSGATCAHRARGRSMRPGPLAWSRQREGTDGAAIVGSSGIDTVGLLRPANLHHRRAKRGAPPGFRVGGGVGLPSAAGSGSPRGAPRGEARAPVTESRALPLRGTNPAVPICMIGLNHLAPRPLRHAAPAVLARRILAALTLLAAAAQAPACTIDECDAGETRCDGNTAMVCGVRSSDAHGNGNPYVWHSTPCTGSTACVASTTRAFCALSASPSEQCTGTGERDTQRCDGTERVTCVAGFAIAREACLSCLPVPSSQGDVECKGGQYSVCKTNDDCITALQCKSYERPDGQVDHNCEPR
jgi:putative transcriptional regulator